MLGAHRFRGKVISWLREPPVGDKGRSWKVGDLKEGSRRHEGEIFFS